MLPRRLLEPSSRGTVPLFNPAQADPPHLIQQASSVPAARATARAAAARSPALSRRRHLLCLRGSRALRLVARRLAGAGGLTYGAEPVGIRKWAGPRGRRRKWPRGLPGLVVSGAGCRETACLRASRRCAVAKGWEKPDDCGRRHRGAAQRKSRGSQARLPPGRDVAFADASEAAQAAPETGAAAGTGCPRGVASSQP